MSSHFDRIYIGTGPINIFDAVYEASSGKKVLMIDSKNQIGGAWVAIPVSDYGKLEIGCHIWSYNKKIYDFIDNQLDVNLVQLKPQPYFLKGKSKLIYDHKNAYLTTSFIAKNILKGKFSKVKGFIKENPSARIPIFPKKYLYPSGGAREFQKAIIDFLSNSDVEVKLNTEINEIHLEDDSWNLYTAGKKTFSSTELVLTATSKLKKLSYYQYNYHFKHRVVFYTHYHFVLKGKLPKSLSYIRVLDHPYIHRISDITNQIPNNDENISVLLIGVFDDQIQSAENKEKIIEILKEYLLNNGFITNENELIYHQLNRFETTYIHESERNAINETGANIEVLATTDLIYGLYYRYKVWQGKGFI